MADGAQRLLDVIDDPNALESFLGTLTSESELLPSAESVDNVVASLSSLAGDYEVDSPNETLFDTFEASSASLTDISQSYVPSDFDNAGHGVYGLPNGLPPSSSTSSSQVSSEVNNAAASTIASGQTQTFEANAHTGLTTNASSSSSASAGTTDVEALVNSTLQQQFPTSICDSSSFSLPTTSAGQQHQQQQSIPSSSPNISSASGNLASFSQLNDIHTQQQQQNANTNQEIVSQSPSLSSSSSNCSNNININSSSSHSGSAVNINNLVNEGQGISSSVSSSTVVTTSSSSPLISVQDVVNNNNSTGITSISGSLVNSAGITMQQQQQQLHLQQQQLSQQQQQQTILQNQQSISISNQTLQSQQSAQTSLSSLQQQQLSQVQQQIQQLTPQQQQQIQQLVSQQQQQQQQQTLQINQQQQQQFIQINQQQQQQQQATQILQQPLQQGNQQLQQSQVVTSQHQVLQQQNKDSNQVSVQSSIGTTVSSISNSLPQVSNISTSTTGNTISLQVQNSTPSSQPSFIVSTAGQTVNQIAVQQAHQQQAVSIGNMTVGSLMSSTTANTGLVSNVISGAQGTNVMHIQHGAQGQQFITVDAQSAPTLIAAATGGATFGAANLVLATAGGTPTYAVLPTGPQLFANAIMQPQIQALKNSTGQTFFQTANGSIVAANTIQGLQTAGVQNLNVQNIRAKTQPQILPKPATAIGVATSVAGTASVATVGGDGQVITSTADQQQQQQAQQQSTQQGQHVNVNVGQLLQQQAGQLQVHQNATTGIVTSMSGGGVTFSQPSFTINSAGGIGQVMVSGVGGAAQSAQLANTATIVLNQFGQPVLLPTGGASQGNGLQLILRQQPAQPQVLTIQTPQGTSAATVTAAGQGATATKLVRYVPQLTQNQTVQIQQIQTPNGPAYIAVRCPQPATTQATPTATQFVGQLGSTTQQTTVQTSTESSGAVQQVTQVAHPAVTTPRTPAPPASQPQQVHSSPAPAAPATPSFLNTLQQQTLASITQKTKQQITIKTERVTEPPRPTFNNTSKQPSAIPQDTSSNSSTASAAPSTPTPAATPKKKKPSKKKKVTLDLDEILKQSGIGDEDLQMDDSCFENIPTMPMQNDSSNGYQYTPAQQTTTSVVNAATSMQPNQSLVKPNGSLSKPELPVNILSPHVHVLQPTTHLPKGGRSNNKNNNNNNNSNSPGGAGSSVTAKKSTPKKSPAKRKATEVNNGEPPNKMGAPNQANSSFGNASAGQQKFTYTPPQNSPNNANNRNAQKKNSPKTSQFSNNNNNIINNNFNNKNIPSSQSVNSNTATTTTTNNKKKPSPKKSPTTPKGVAGKNAPAKRPMVTNTSAPSPAPPSQVQTQATPANTPQNTVTISQPRASPAANGQNAGGSQRIVHTIQLTPQNQQLLRNIQAQIHRLISLPKRNETEQTALQKLIFLQQQVIATGTPVPSPVGNNSSGSVIAGTTITTSATPQSPAATSNPTTIVPSSSPTIQSSSISSSHTFNSSVRTVPAQSGSSTNYNAFASTSSGTSGNYVMTTTTGAITSSSGQNTPTTAKFYMASTSAQTNLVIKSEKTDVTDSISSEPGVKKGGVGPPQGLPAGSTVLVVEDPKIVEQRRAAAKAEEEARAKWRKEQFDFLLKRDQEFFVEPDYKTPFTSKEDAVERLMKYHLGRDRTEMDFEDFDSEFSETAARLLDKFSAMVAKYKFLMLKESMKEVSCAERVMLERMFTAEEKLQLEQDKLLVAQGEILELPPPPEEWVPKLQEMVEADMRELELDSTDNLQVQSAIESIISCGNEDNSSSYQVPDDSEKIEYDAFGVPTSSSSSYGAIGSSSSADIDEAVRSILA